MTFTPEKRKALRRKKRKDSRPQVDPSRAEVRRMTKTGSFHGLRTFATAVTLPDDPQHVGVWVWKEGSAHFQISGDLYSREQAPDVVKAAAPEAEWISAGEFHERTKHVRAAMETNGHVRVSRQNDWNRRGKS